MSANTRPAVHSQKDANIMKNIIRWLNNDIGKAFGSGAIHVLTGTFVNKFVSMFSSIVIIRLLTPTEYGILSYYENLFSYFIVFSGLGLANAILRYVVIGETAEIKYGCYQYSRTRGVLYNIIMASIGVLIAMVYPHSNAFADYWWLLILLVLVLPFNYMYTCGLYTERAMMDAKKYAYSSLTISLVIIIAKLIGAGTFGLVGTISFRLTAEIIMAIFMSALVYHMYFKGVSHSKPTRAERKTINVYALQYMITNGLWYLFMLNDTFLLGRLCNDATVLAIYKVAYILPASLLLFSTSMGIYVGPYFTKNEKKGNIAWVKQNWLKKSVINFCLVGVASLVIFVFARPLVLFIYGEQYLSAVGLMRILVFAAVINAGLRHLTAHILASMGQIKYNMIVSAVGMAFQIVLNIVIIPRYGSIGVAWVSVVIYSAMAIAINAVFIKKYFRSNYECH